MDFQPLGGRYQIIRQLGAGGFSRTFLVQDLHLPSHPKCIIKQLQPQTRDADALEMARRMFDTEAKVLYQLGSHPQIPALLAHFEENQEFYLAQEYIEGTHLSREFVKGVSWPQARVILLMQEVLKILSFVHKQQVIHRDIKPSNLIRRFQDNQIVLIDFGAVKHVSTSPLQDVETDTTNLTVAVGTQGYMPNEQYAGKPRYSSDVYAVGMLGIRALTGIHPKKIIDDPITGELAWRQCAPAVDPALAEVIDTMVRYDFRDRYPTAVEALAALDNLPESKYGIYCSGTAYPVSRLTAQGVVKEEVSLSLQMVESAHQGVPETEEALSMYDTEPTLLFQHADNGQDQSSSSWVRAAAEPALPSPQQAVEGRMERWHRHSQKMVVGAASLMTVIGVAAVTTIVASRQPRLLSSVSPPDLPVVPRQVLSVLTPEQVATFHVEQADQLLNQGQPRAALVAYDRAIQIQQDAAAAHLGRCISFLRLEQPNDAIVACNDALAYRGYFPEAVLRKGNALEQQGQLLEALQHYESANRQMPAMFAAWLDRGRVLHRLGRSAEAIQALDQAIARDRNSVEAWAIRGQANWALRRFDQAIVDLDKALMLQPDHAQALQLRREARRQLGR